MENNNFTVGDRIKYENNNYTISRFETLNEKCLVGLIGLQYLVSLKDIQHVKQKLFTTEDGVDIFEGETYYYTNKEFILVENIAIKEINYKRNCEVIRFSTKEAAEEYIVLRKPCLSINDLKKFTYKSAEFMINVNEIELKELVKSKF